MEREEYKFTLKDVLDLINPVGDLEDVVIIWETCGNESKRSILPLNSSLLTPKEILSRKVSFIYTDVYNGAAVVHIWLASETE